MAGSLALLVFARPSLKMLWIGLPMVVAGELVRLWSAGYLTKLSGLVTAGPFALCRNPLYIGSFLISLGYMFMCNQMIAFPIGIAAFWLLHGGAVAYEEKLLREAFGEDYIRYCREVPRFFPRPRSLAGQGDFSLKRMMGNDEGRGAVTILLIAGAYGLMAVRSFSILSWLSTLAG